MNIGYELTFDWLSEEIEEHPEAFIIDMHKEKVLDAEFHGADKWEWVVVEAKYQTSRGEWIDLNHHLDEIEIYKLNEILK